MEDVHRRAVLGSGTALAVSGIASISVGASGNDDDNDNGDNDDNGDDSDATALPDSSLESTPEADAAWPSYRGDAGHSRSVADEYTFDDDALAVDWTVDAQGSVAVVDDTVYTTTADSVVALEADDGTINWETDGVDAHDPAVAGDSVYLADEEVVALDRNDGSIRWESDLEPDEWLSRHTVAFDGVFVVVDGTLYALEADDGSVRWERPSVGIETGMEGETEEYEFTMATAAANGVLYAGTSGGVVALEPETGDVVWQFGMSHMDRYGHQIHASASEVVATGWTNVEHGVYDAQSGEWIGEMEAETFHDPAVGEEFFTSGGNYTFYGNTFASVAGESSASDDRWAFEDQLIYGQGVICGGTVYVYLWSDGDESGSEYHGNLLAIDKDDGSEQWRLSTDEIPVGEVLAVDEETIYVDHEDELVALREQPDEGDEEDEEGTGDDEDEDDDSGGGEIDLGGDGGGGRGGSDDGASDDSDNETPRDDGGSDPDTNDTDTDSGGDNATIDSDDPGTESEPSPDDADEVPGFTTGAGLLGGALGLEWLRRKTGMAESAD